MADEVNTGQSMFYRWGTYGFLSRTRMGKHCAGFRIGRRCSYAVAESEVDLNRAAPLDIQTTRYYIMRYVMEEHGIGNHCQGTGHHPEVHPRTSWAPAG